ncbi:hypothetical protein HM131_15170 [Halobacillus mangrovi]|uniref:Uncharacterized protein n=1 Tax=Halobacillus mangrovi TaxID=402384 RepID=A0A1W5ZXX7_9BACI|nr:hypothetical protein HM131_15170 [Halobacillus mangrovi]
MTRFPWACAEPPRANRSPGSHLSCSSHRRLAISRTSFRLFGVTETQNEEVKLGKYIRPQED